MYILERKGWGQWLDDGGRWQSNRSAAKRFPDRDAAEEAATAENRNLGFGGDNDDDDSPTAVVEV